MNKKASVLLMGLHATQLFKGVDLGALQYLLDQCPIHELNAKDELISLGATDSRLFVVLEGEFGIHVQDPEDEPVAIVGPGSTVGEVAALDKKPRSAAVVARGPSKVMAIDAETFWDLISQSHRLSLNLLHVLSERLRGNNATIVDNRRLQEQYKRHASTDPLTGLLNRRGLDDVGNRLLRRLKVLEKPMSLLMLDVDHFKRFNDDHGHQAGDYVLFAVAQVLKNGLRPTDIVARYGGEEFTVLLPETPLDGAEIAAERIREAVASTPLELDNGKKLPRVTTSVGAAQAVGGDTLASLIERADAALYQAKENGRNQVKLALPSAS